MKPTLLTSYKQIREGDLFYTSVGAGYTLDLTYGRVSEVTEDFFKVCFFPEEPELKIEKMELKDILLLRRNEAGELEVLAGENIFKALTS